MYTMIRACAIKQIIIDIKNGVNPDFEILTGRARIPTPKIDAILIKNLY